jgi:hypothetical protein
MGGHPRAATSGCGSVPRPARQGCSSLQITMPRCIKITNCSSTPRPDTLHLDPVGARMRVSRIQQAGPPVAAHRSKAANPSLGHGPAARSDTPAGGSSATAPASAVRASPGVNGFEKHRRVCARANELCEKGVIRDNSVPCLCGKAFLPPLSTPPDAAGRETTALASLHRRDAPARGGAGVCFSGAKKRSADAPRSGDVQGGRIESRSRAARR